MILKLYPDIFSSSVTYKRHSHLCICSYAPDLLVNHVTIVGRCGPRTLTDAVGCNYSGGEWCVEGSVVTLLTPQPFYMRCHLKSIAKSKKVNIPDQIKWHQAQINSSSERQLDKCMSQNPSVTQLSLRARCCETGKNIFFCYEKLNTVQKDFFSFLFLSTAARCRQLMD